MRIDLEEHLYLPQGIIDLAVDLIEGGDHDTCRKIKQQRPKLQPILQDMPYPRNLGYIGDGRSASSEFTFLVYNRYGINQSVERTAIPLDEPKFAGLFVFSFYGFPNMGLEDA